MPGTFPRYVEILLWDVDPETIDLVAHQDYLLERIMSRGGWKAMCWLRDTVDISAMADFLRRRGSRPSRHESWHTGLSSRPSRPRTTPVAGPPDGPRDNTPE